MAEVICVDDEYYMLMDSKHFDSSRQELKSFWAKGLPGQAGCTNVLQPLLTLVCASSGSFCTNILGS